MSAQTERIWEEKKGWNINFQNKKAGEVASLNYANQLGFGILVKD